MNSGEEHPIRNILTSQIDKFVNRAYRNGYVTEKSNFREIINKRDKRLWEKILNDRNNALREFLPNKLNRTLRQRGHDLELPSVKTERFKKSFVNRCLKFSVSFNA